MAIGSGVQLSITKKFGNNVENNEDCLVYEEKEERKIHSLIIEDCNLIKAAPFVTRIANNAFDNNTVGLNTSGDNNSTLKSDNISDAVLGHAMAKSITPSCIVTNILAKKPTTITKGRAMGRGPAR